MMQLKNHFEKLHMSFHTRKIFNWMILGTSIVILLAFLGPSVAHGQANGTVNPKGTVTPKAGLTQDAAATVACGTAPQQGALQSMLGVFEGFGDIFSCFGGTENDAATNPGKVPKNGSGGLGCFGGAASGVVDLFGGWSGVQGLLANSGILNNLAGDINLGDLENLGSVLGDIDLGGLEDIFGGGGGISGIAGNIPGVSSIPGVSIITGGGAVPVSDARSQGIQSDIQARTAGLLANSTEHLGILCVKNPTVYQLHQAQLAEMVGLIVNHLATGREGEPFRVENFGQLIALSQQNATKTFTDDLGASPIEGNAKAQIIGWITSMYGNNTDGQTRGERLGQILTEISRPNTGGDAVTALRNTMLGCQDNIACAMLATMDAVQAERDEAEREALFAAQTGDGYLPQVVCIDKDGNEIPGKFEECPTSARTVVSSQNIAASSRRADEAGIEQLRLADEVGKTVNPILAGLFQRAIQNIFGYDDLSENDTDGGGSYLDQLDGTSNTSVVDTSRGFVAGAITDSLNAEAQYQATLGTMISNLNIARSAYADLEQCYITLAAIPSPGIPSETIASRKSQASAVIHSIIDPQIALRTEELEGSQAITAELARLRGASTEATSAEAVNSVQSAYEALTASGLAHSSADVALLAQDLSGSAGVWQTAVSTASAGLAECRALSTPTTSVTIPTS